MNKKMMRNTILALCAFCAALVINYYAGQYTALVGPDSCTIYNDFFLSRLPYYDWSIFFVWGYAFFIAVVLFSAILFERSRIPYFISMYAALIILRSFFIILTPFNRPPLASNLENVTLYNHVGSYLTFGYEFFFSSHTSLPFLGFLMFKHKPTRFLLLILSLALAFTALISRYHYSIDVFGAFFIVYALYQLEKQMSTRPRF